MRLMLPLLIILASLASPATAQGQGPFKQYCNYEDGPNEVFFLGPCTVKYVSEGDNFFALYQMKNKILRVQLNLGGDSSPPGLFKDIMIAGNPGFDVEVDRTHHIYIREDRQVKLEVQDWQAGFGNTVASSF